MTPVGENSGNHAILDLDGTLMPGVLGIRYLNDLGAEGVCDQAAVNACVQAIESYAAGGGGPHGDLMAEAYRRYAAALNGVSYADARATAARTWKACRQRLFPFAERLIGLLKEHGYQIHLISGNADLPIQEAVSDLGLASGHGAVTEVVRGCFTGRLVGAPGLPGGKSAVMQSLTAARDFDRRTAIALGNGAMDAEVFACVDTAVAFEPDQELRLVAESSGWHIVDRQTVLPAIARLLDGMKRG